MFTSERVLLCLVAFVLGSGLPLAQLSISGRPLLISPDLEFHGTAQLGHLCLLDAALVDEFFVAEDRANDLFHARFESFVRHGRRPAGVSGLSGEDLDSAERKAEPQQGRFHRGAGMVLSCTVTLLRPGRSGLLRAPQLCGAPVPPRLDAVGLALRFLMLIDGFDFIRSGSGLFGALGTLHCGLLCRRRPLQIGVRRGPFALEAISCGGLGAFCDKPVASAASSRSFADELCLGRCLLGRLRFLLRGLLGLCLLLVKTSFIG